VPGIGRSHGCARGLFLVAEVDERRPVQVPLEREPQARLRVRLGLATLPCAPVVKGRRKPVPGGDTAAPVTGCLRFRFPQLVKAKAEFGVGAEEAALVEGRRSGSREVIAFDEAAAKKEPGSVSRAWRKPKPNRKAATENARGYAASSVCGR